LCKKSEAIALALPGLMVGRLAVRQAGRLAVQQAGRQNSAKFKNF